ncbi:sulfite reductase (NADPH) flavoprotein alpha-component [Rheinheimera pacifica]|uniref:sulfite reductase flavoprotein subunit alpha n=1 Tax=Rheinheimera pacifica TaxID=173990 RepID=UPI002166C487|nr:sulfite reductase flavoprotein subunit alpha [Rheinheimera pacifica]MCS4309579.1 sulfite reductase (NADPH) flavoprotein alpha-component [Rheinheimera pacifica]
MLQRWQTKLEWLNLVVLLLLPLYHLYSAGTMQPDSLILLYLFNLAALIASFRLKPYSAAVKELPASAWLEQHLLLALILTLLWWFYLPLAPFAQPQAQWLWLSTQLSIMGLLLRLCWAVKKQPPASATGGQHWLVGYASQSGMAQQLAQSSAKQLQQAGFSVALAELNQLTQQQLNQYQKALFVVSTYGEGEAPDNASQFYQLAQQWQSSLSQLQFAVLALGDRSYQQFCAFGHWLQQWLHSREAQALQPLLELDSSERQSAALTQWQQLLTGFTASLTAQQTQVIDNSASWLQASLSSRYIANPASTGLPCYIVKLQPPAGTHWQAGDIVDIQPENSKCNVALWLTRHQINGCQAVHYQGRHIPLCWALAELQLDKVQPPANGETLPQWLATQPKLPLRSYSVASIPGEGPITLLVRQVQYNGGALGIGSGWLTAWAMEQQPVQIRLRSHSQFHLPAHSSDTPVIFIANGTGIAGIRALLAQRVALGQRQNWLLFGERMQQNDFFFARDIQQWQQHGFISHCSLAFSQDQAEKSYVQHVLAEQQQQLLQWLAQGAAIYVCGSLHGMGEAVHDVLLQAIGEAGLAQLIQQGRYRRDLY